MKTNTNYDKLLDLIEADDAESLLLEDNLAESFNELMNKNLVHMEQGKVYLTDLGKEARNLGINVVVQRENSNHAPLEIPMPVLEVKHTKVKQPVSHWLWLLIFLVSLMIFFSFQLII